MKLQIKIYLHSIYKTTLFIKSRMTLEMFIRSGYMAPEYAMHGQFSVKSDVFSFGVIILEIVSGQKNNCFQKGKRMEDLVSRVSMSIQRHICFCFVRNLTI